MRLEYFQMIDRVASLDGEAIVVEVTAPDAAGGIPFLERHRLALPVEAGVAADGVGGVLGRLVESQPSAASYDLLGWAFYANGLTNEARAAAAAPPQGSRARMRTCA